MKRKLINSNPTINKLLLIIYIIITIALPVVGLFSLIGDSAFNTVKFLTGAWRITFIFFSVPVYLVYAVMMFKEHFPAENKKAFLLTASSLVPYIVYLFQKPGNFFTFLAESAFPIYFGLNIMFLIGLIFIIFKKEGITDSIYVVIGGFILLLALLFYPVGYFFAFAIWMHQNLNDNLIMFILIFLFIYSHYKQLIRMYKQGEL